jgi:hypothetical protein
VISMFMSLQKRTKISLSFSVLAPETLTLPYPALRSVWLHSSSLLPPSSLMVESRLRYCQTVCSSHRLVLCLCARHFVLLGYFYVPLDSSYLCFITRNRLYYFKDGGGVFLTLPLGVKMWALLLCTYNLNLPFTLCGPGLLACMPFCLV